MSKTDPKVKEEMRPCPCCGGKARVHIKRGVRGIAGTSFYREQISCNRKSCGVSTPVFKRPNKARKIWDRRAA